MLQLEGLGVPFPDGRRIDTWIDWLPYLQFLAEDGNLRDARSLDPYEKTISRIGQADREPE